MADDQAAYLRELEEEGDRPRRVRQFLPRRVVVRKGGGGLSVTVAVAAGQSSPVNAGPINFTVTFNKPATGFTNADISFTGSTVGGTPAAAVTGSNPYNVAVTGMTGNGLVQVSIPAAAATDATGAPFPASNSASVTLDTTQPSVTINKAAGQADPTAMSTINFTVIFSKSVTGFTNSDVSFTGSTAGTLAAAVTGSGTTYNVAVTGMSTVGNVVASIPAGGAADVAGNTNTVSTSTDNTVAFDSGDVWADIDGRAMAPTGAPQLPTMLAGFAARPPWQVSGVDYRVGVNTGVTLKDIRTDPLPSGVTRDTPGKFVVVGSPNTTMDGWECDGGGAGWQIGVTAANCIIKNCHFTVGTANISPIATTSAANNLYVGYCTFDCAVSDPGPHGGLIDFVASGLTVEYCYLHGGGDTIQLNGGPGGNILFQYNLVDTPGVTAPDVHGDFVQVFASLCPSFVVKFNASRQASGTNTQGWMVEQAQTGEIGWNTFTGTTTVCVGLRVADLTAIYRIHDNYYEPPLNSFAHGFAGGTQPGDANPLTVFEGNVNMVTGLPASNDTAPPSVATDNFNRADGALGSSWVTDRVAATIVSNQVKCSGSGNGVSVRTAEVFAANQYSQIVWQATGINGGGPVVRHNSGNPGSYYVAFYTGGTTIFLSKVTAGSYSTLDTLTVALLANGDVLRLEISSNTLTVKVNGTSVGTATDAASPFTTGRPGIEIFDPNVIMDDWQGGDP